MTPDVATVMGSYNRLPLLQACVESLRRAQGSLSHVALVADGGSTDGTREWLVKQPDCELLEGGLEGAVRAFNIAYARSIDLGAQWINQFNDDLTFLDGLEFERGVAKLVADPSIGAVAYPSDRYTPGKWTFDNMRYHGVCYANQGLFRREAGMAAARALGDPEGKKWWDTRFHTYAADTVLGLCLWRLGWTIHEAADMRVHDGFTSEAGHLDPLRKRNLDLYTNNDLFQRCWGDPAGITYNREAAMKFGGRVW